MYDYFIICSARTTRHLKSIPEALSQLHRDELGAKCITEGTKATDGWSTAGLFPNNLKVLRYNFSRKKPMLSSQVHFEIVFQQNIRMT